MRLTSFITSILLLFSCSEGTNPGNSSTPNPVEKITYVTPTNIPAPEGSEYKNLRLCPGKLIGLEQITESVCKRANAANMWIDAIARDKNMWAEGATDELREYVCYEAGRVLQQTGTKLWGMHLPYSTYDIGSLDENHRTEAVSKLKHIMDITVEHLKPHHLVLHPSTGSYLTTDATFAQHKAASQKSIAALQAELDRLNNLYGTSTILCVENCSKSVAYDSQSLLELLDYPGLEKTRICIDTGHALIPQNGKYIDTKSGEDVVQALKNIGRRLGTLHIQQNIGINEYPYDKHIEPWNGGLIAWGEVYKALLNECGYRGCFLYEVSWIDSYESGNKSSIESCRENYDKIIIPQATLALKK